MKKWGYQKRLHRKTETIANLPRKSHLDIWLSRLSNLSQMGILILAIFGYFYTVLPVYEKSLLNEQISKKEIELRNLQTKIDLMYTKERKSITKQLFKNATYNCAGIKKLLEPLNFSKEPISKKEHLPEEFEIDMQKCIKDALYKSETIKDSLNATDFTFLVSQISDIGERLSQIQKELSNKYISLPIDAERDPTILAPLRKNSFQLRTLNFLKPTLSEKEYDSYLFNAKVEQALFDISAKFRNSIYDEIGSLIKIEWPTCNEDSMSNCN